MARRRKSYRANKPVVAYNKIDLRDNSQPMSADNLPVGLRDGKYTGGTPREEYEGKCIVGNGIAFVEIIGLLTTDTFEVEEGSDMPTCTVNGRLDIASGNKIYGLKVYRASVLIGFYKCDTESTTTLFQTDTSLLLGNGTFFNYYSGLWGSQNVKSYQNDVGYTLSDGATYYYDNGWVDLIEAGFLIPRDESNPTKCCAYLSNGTQADLQYKGLCPSKLKFVNTPCFRGNNSGFFDAGNVSSFNIPNISIKYKVIKDLDDFIFRGIMAINQLPNVAGIGIAEGSAGDVLIYLQGVSGSPFRPPQHPVGYSANEVKIIQGSFVSFWRDGVEIFNQAITGTISSHASSTTKIGNANSNPLDSNFKIFDVEISELNSSGAFVQKLANFPLSEYMQTPSTHIAFDVIGGNYAALINGSTANRGIATRPDGDYSQLGYALSDGINYYYDQALTELIPSGVKIPAHAVQSGKCAAYTTGGVLADLTVVQDGKSFLDTESKVEAAEKPRLIQAEKTTGNRFFTDTSDNVVKKSFSDFTGNEDDQHFSDVSETGKAKSITAHTKELTGQQKNTELRITNN